MLIVVILGFVQNQNFNILNGAEAAARISAPDQPAHEGGHEAESGCGRASHKQGENLQVEQTRLHPREPEEACPAAVLGPGVQTAQ